MPEAVEEAKFKEVFDGLKNFVYWLAYRREISSVPLLYQDELEGELFEELVKGFRYYTSKNMSKSEMMAVIRKMLDNRIVELYAKYLNTHRKAGLNSVGMDDSDIEELMQIDIEVQIIADVSVQMASPQTLLESEERVAETRKRLSPTAQEVFDAAIDGHPIIHRHLQLAGIRAGDTHTEVKVRPYYVSDALSIDPQDVLDAFDEIRLVYAEVCREF